MTNFRGKLKNLDPQLRIGVIATKANNTKMTLRVSSHEQITRLIPLCIVNLNGLTSFNC